MATSWNADARAFQVGDRLIPFTLYDIALILGLPVRGEPIDCNQSHSGGSVVEKLLNRHLKTTSPERTQLVTLLTKPSIQVPNRVRLYIALVFSYFLFPTTSKKVNPSLLPLLDDRANLGTYAWGKAVYDFLVSGLSRAASSMQAKKGRGNLHIQGCTALLQIWACEHLGVGQKNAEINQPFPRFLAWTHQRMYTKKAREAFSNSANVSAVRACSNAMGARVQCVGDRLIPFTLYDIALILGLPVRGEPIDCNQSHSGGSVVEKLLNRHLKTTSPERTQLVTLLTKPSIQVPNRVRLYIALVFSYFLFPTTSKKVNTSLLPLLDDRANLGTYAWGKAVYDFLVSGLSRAASSMQAKKGRGNLHIQGCTAEGLPIDNQ
uniref:Aminotransferase-like plant mobile domain-containing protein n=1 Tax=Fagus sylvatica TaxID=28930 RepID=A0A2N9F2H2_FAGSY